MTSYFISRHPGAIEWAKNKSVHVDIWLTHLSADISVSPGDCFFGTLPVNLVADICARGGRYFHLSFNIPPDLRGAELDAATMEQLSVRLEEFTISSQSKGRPDGSGREQERLHP